MKTKKTILSVFAALALPTLVLAANTPTFSQTITGGTLAVDIVDNTGTPVDTPTVPFASQAFSFGELTSTGRLGDTTDTGQLVRVYVPRSATNWTVSLAATNGPGSTWSDGTNAFDFNDSAGSTDGGDSDSVGGQLTWLSGGTFTGVPDSAACPTTGLSIGSQTAFEEGTTDSVNILTSGTSTQGYCRWDYSSAADNLSQVIPASQPAGSYALEMTLTIL